MRALTELKKECMGRVIEYWDEICCFVCYESRPKRLTIHHHCYTKQSVTYNQFENSDDGRLKYYAHLLDEIKSKPGNFTILCINCHNELEDSLKKYFKEKTRYYDDDYRLDSIFEKTIKSREEKPLQTIEHRQEKPPHTTGVDDFFWS